MGFLIPLITAAGSAFVASRQRGPGSGYQFPNPTTIFNPPPGGVGFNPNLPGQPPSSGFIEQRPPEPPADDPSRRRESELERDLPWIIIGVDSFGFPIYRDPTTGTIVFSTEGTATADPEPQSPAPPTEVSSEPPPDVRSVPGFPQDPYGGVVYIPDSGVPIFTGGVTLPPEPVMAGPGPEIPGVPGAPPWLPPFPAMPGPPAPPVEPALPKQPAPGGGEPSGQEPQKPAPGGVPPAMGAPGGGGVSGGPMPVGSFPVVGGHPLQTLFPVQYPVPPLIASLGRLLGGM